MINPAKLIKLKTEKDHFVKRHPEFVRFLAEQIGNAQAGDEFVVYSANSSTPDDSSKLVFTKEDIQVLQMIRELL